MDEDPSIKFSIDGRPERHREVAQNLPRAVEDDVHGLQFCRASSSFGRSFAFDPGDLHSEL